GDAGRSPDNPQTPQPGSDDVTSQDSDEDDEEDEDEGKVQEDTPAEKAKEEETAAPPTPTQDTVEVCKTVAELFSKVENLTKACEQKYGHPQRHWGWKCVDTTTKSGDTGGLCIPPRRRRLYVGKLEQWAENTQSSQSQAVSSDTTLSSSNSRDDDALRDAFIQSAAIETFFLWDRYKKEKEKEEKEKQQLVIDTSQLGKELQKKLQQNGEIPPDFLRQMFYTLGDYRDILFRKNDILIDTKNVDKDIAEREKKIKGAIQKFFSNSDSTPAPRGGPQPQPNSDNDPKSWWDENAKHIWNAMVCALTYKENEDKNTSEGTQKIKKDEQVYEKFFGTPNGNPGLAPGTYTTRYKYDEVELKEDNTSSAMSTSSSSSSGDDPLNNPKLSKFVVRPPYFRYLEEWGQNFCKERKKRLAQIYKDCKVEENGGSEKQYSGDGEACDRTNTSNGVFAELEGPSCATP
ncbi:hypothetical protein PFTANZ_06504, partial [Plasmodium falciparum Tanzania (2000708)]